MAAISAFAFGDASTRPFSELLRFSTTLPTSVPTAGAAWQELRETARDATTSTVAYTYGGKVGSVGGPLWIAVRITEIAIARERSHFIVLKEWDQDRSHYFLVGFTNDPNATVKSFGPGYAETNDQGQSRELMSVEQFRPLLQVVPSTAPTR